MGVCCAYCSAPLLFILNYVFWRLFPKNTSTYLSYFPHPSLFCDLFPTLWNFTSFYNTLPQHPALFPSKAHHSP